MNCDKILFWLATHKNDRKHRILMKDGQFHSVDTRENYGSVSIVVPSITHYWINMLEEAEGRSLTAREYAVLSKRLDKVITQQMYRDYVKSIKEYPDSVVNAISVDINEGLRGALSTKMDTHCVPQEDCTLYKMVNGNIIVKNQYKDNSDDYYVYTDRWYNAKGYKVNLGVQYQEDKELKFEVEQGNKK